ncbi:MAG: hypothetical protein Q9219_004912 [cf. Caloplaca sp. 3 TL-2023]
MDGRHKSYVELGERSRVPDKAADERSRCQSSDEDETWKRDVERATLGDGLIRKTITIRQTNIIRFDLEDKDLRIRYLKELENGIQLLLLRHREIFKVEIKQDQYWLRQDYARTNLDREKKNLEVLQRDPNAAKIPWDKIFTPSGTAIAEAHNSPYNSQLSHVEMDDLWIDDNGYEYNEISTDMVASTPQRSLSRNGQPESSLIGLKGNSSLTVRKIGLDTIISIKEVHSRFEDIKRKATAYIDQWKKDDSHRAKKIAVLYPQKLRTYYCTPEHHLYHAHLSTFASLKEQLRLESILLTEIRKADVRMEIQQMMTAARQNEVDSFLQAIEQHVLAQIADVSAAQGTQGRTEALIYYLRRYDGRDDIRAPEQWDRVSGATTLELLGKADDMLRRWREEDKHLGKRVEDMVKGEDLGTAEGTAV